MYPWKLRSLKLQWRLQWLGGTIPSNDHDLPTFNPLPSASSETLESLPRHRDDGQSVVLAPIHHEGLVQATKTIAEMVGVMRAESETGLEKVAVYQRAPSSALPKLPSSDKSLLSHGTVRVNTSQGAELRSMLGQQIICNPWPRNSGCHFLRCCSSRKVEV